jgi:hypothetical protein
MISASERNFDNNLFNKFQDEAPNAWKKYTQSLSKMNGSLITRNLQNGKIITEQTSNNCLLYPCNVREYSDGVDTVCCVGTNYAFLLEKKSGSDNWLIRDIKQLVGNRPTLQDWQSSLFGELVNEELIGRNFRYVQYYIFQGIQLYANTYLPSIVKLPEFKVKNIYLESINGVNRVHLDYEFEPDPLKYETFAVRSGTLILLPDSWLIESGKFDVEMSDTRLHYTVQCFYEDDSSDTPKLKRKILSTSHNNVEISSVFEFDINQDSNIPLSRFTLSHYGLPEPDFGDQRISRIRYIVIGIGFLLIAVSLLIKLLRHYHKPSK